MSCLRQSCGWQIVHQILLAALVLQALVAAADIFQRQVRVRCLALGHLLHTGQGKAQCGCISSWRYLSSGSTCALANIAGVADDDGSPDPSMYKTW